MKQGSETHLTAGHTGTRTADVCWVTKQSETWAAANAAAASGALNLN